MEEEAVRERKPNRFRRAYGTPPSSFSRCLPSLLTKASRHTPRYDTPAQGLAKGKVGRDGVRCASQVLPTTPTPLPSPHHTHTVLVSAPMTHRGRDPANLRQLSIAP